MVVVVVVVVVLVVIMVVVVVVVFAEGGIVDQNEVRVSEEFCEFGKN